MNAIEKAKDAAGKAAVNLIKDGMLLGIGTGSTTAYFIQHLIKKVEEGLKIEAIATSFQSQALTRLGNIKVLDSGSFTKVDLTIDGADKIDHKKRMIKGGGGALLREKILAYNSTETVIIVDTSKLVDKLGKFPLPIEILPFGFTAIQKQIESFGFYGTFRKLSNGNFYITENGNLLFDIQFEKPPENIEAVNLELKTIPGVLETGLFFGVAQKVIIGYPDGTFEIRE